MGSTRPLNRGGGEARGAAPHPWAPGALWPPPLPAPFRPANTSAHLESLSLQAGSQARTSGNTCSPPWEWRSASPEGGRGGRAAGAQSLHYVSGLQMCADVATPGPGRSWSGRGPGALGSPGMRFPPQPSPQPLGPPPRRPPSSSLPPFPLLPAPGHFAGLVAFSGTGWGLGGSPCLAALSPDFGPHLPVLLLLPLWTFTPRGLPTVGGLPGPPVLWPLLWLLGPVAETLVLIWFRCLRRLQAEAERVAQGAQSWARPQGAALFPSPTPAPFL